MNLIITLMPVKFWMNAYGKMSYLPGIYFISMEGANTFRLGLPATPEEIRQGFKIIGDVIRVWNRFHPFKTHFHPYQPLFWRIVGCVQL